MIVQASLMRKQLGLLQPLRFRVHIYKCKESAGLRITLLGGALSAYETRLLRWRLESFIPTLNALAEGQAPIETIILEAAQYQPRLYLPSAVL